MKSLAMTVNLKDDPETIQKYKEHHAAVWPEVLTSLKQVGVIDMKIYLLGRRLFMTCEVEDGFIPEVDFPEYLKLDPKCQEWEDLMGTFQEPVEEAQPEEKWAKMEEIFSF